MQFHTLHLVTYTLFMQGTRFDGDEKRIDILSSSSHIYLTFYISETLLGKLYCVSPEG